jgi:hypothetical protein
MVEVVVIEGRSREINSIHVQVASKNSWQAANT